MLMLDHIAICCSDLTKGTRDIADLLRVPLETGGMHAHFGTHNSLLGLGPGLYLEVIAKNPEADATGRPTWFGLDQFTGPTRLGNWICATSDLPAAMAAMPTQAGEITALTRGSLSWEITVPQDGSLPLDAGQPTLLRWGQGIESPAASLADRGCRLVTLTVHHPRASDLSQMPLNDPRVVFTPAEKPRLGAQIRTPHGVVDLP